MKEKEKEISFLGKDVISGGVEKKRKSQSDAEAKRKTRKASRQEKKGISFFFAEKNCSVRMAEMKCGPA